MTQLSPPHVNLTLGTLEHPIIHFRPQLWRHLETTRDALNLDLFWPQKLHELVGREEEDSENIQCERHTFPLEGLVPMCEFRRLRALRLGGMLQSYQTYIWRTCWLNPGLEEVVLEMALEPTMNESDRFWTLINGMWRRKAISEACTDYLGEFEDGSLCDSVGTGEYLDKNAMASGRSAVSSQGINIRYLPIARLVLAGFVVDAGPFFRWFNPIRLRKIEFKHGCIDAGFAFPSPMSNSVTVTWPGKTPPRDKMITVTRVDPQNVKRVRLKRKSSIRGPETSGVKPKTISVMTKNWLSPARKYSLKV